MVTECHKSNAVYPFKCQLHKMVKHAQTIRWLSPTNCLSVFDDFVGLTLKGTYCDHVEVFDTLFLMK